MNFIILVAPNSIHSKRYLSAIATQFDNIILITNISFKEDTPANVSEHIINFSLFNIKAKWQIAKIIKTSISKIVYSTLTKPITVHIHQANSYAYHTLQAIKLVKENKFKAILTTWGSDILLLPHKNFLFKYMVRFNLANSNMITSDSLYMSSKIRQLCPTAQKIKTINFGVQNMPNTLDLTHKEDLIVSTRLHKKLYNIDKIILGFAKLIQNPNYEHYKLAIVAHGEETVYLKSLVTKHKLTSHVTFYGILNAVELAKLYQKAKIFVSVPNSDATSVSLLEAMAYGCYPITSNLPANLEWVLDEINGLICQNLDNLASNLESSLTIIDNQEKYYQVAQFNYKMIQKKANFNNNIQRFLDLY